MKSHLVKIACLCIAGALVFLCSAKAEEKRRHLFMDIPFGITEEACEAIIRQQPSLSLSPERNADEATATRTLLPNPFRWFGLPMKVDLQFSNNALCYVFATMYGEQSDATSQSSFIEGLERYFALLDRAEDMYGSPTDGMVVAFVSGESRIYNYPQKAGARDQDALMDICLSKVEMLVFSESFGNVNVLLLRHYYTKDGESLCGYTLEMRYGEEYGLPPVFLSPPFIGRDGDFPDQLYPN